MTANVLMTPAGSNPIKVISAPSAAQAARVRVGPQRLLIVDDDALLASVFGRIGRAIGFDVIVTNEPADVRRRVRTWQPDVVLLDLAMPGIDGVELLRLLGNDACAAKVLIVSAFDRKTIEYAHALGLAHGLDVAGVLQKPCSADAVDALLRTVLDVAGGADLAAPAAVEQALASQQMFLEYQPQVDLRTSKVVGVEALLRWRHPRYGFLPPSVFVPMMEEADMLASVTKHVLATAVHQRCEWLRHGLDLDIAVNVSARDFAAFDVAGVIEEQFGRMGVEPSGLMLEITESAAAPDHTSVAKVLRHLPGVRLSIDDFGIGYSSLASLRRLPIAEVKIDRSFVTECETSREKLAVVQSIVDLAHVLGMRTVAEGIEGAATAAAVAGTGCDLAQGFYFARPMAGDNIPKWCAASQDSPHS